VAWNHANIWGDRDRFVTQYYANTVRIATAKMQDWPYFAADGAVLAADAISASSPRR